MSNMRKSTKWNKNFFTGKEPGGVLEVTIRRMIEITLQKQPWLSAYQISRIIGKDSNSVASECLRMVKEGVLERKKGKGPRGGYGYTL